MKKFIIILFLSLLGIYNTAIAEDKPSKGKIYCGLPAQKHDAAPVTTWTGKVWVLKKQVTDETTKVTEWKPITVLASTPTNPEILKRVLDVYRREDSKTAYKFALHTAIGSLKPYWGIFNGPQKNMELGPIETEILQ